VASEVIAEAAELERQANAFLIDAPRVNLRSGPSTQHRVVEVLTKATPVFPKQNEGEWLLVRTLDGPAGWIHASLVRRR
jgi:SH3-like domain-containing protein